MEIYYLKKRKEFFLLLGCCTEFFTDGSYKLLVDRCKTHSSKPSIKCQPSLLQADMTIPRLSIREKKKKGGEREGVERKRGGERERGERRPS